MDSHCYRFFSGAMEKSISCFEIRCHAVERLGEVLDFITRFEIEPLVQPTTPDLLHTVM